jgi:uncharacterized membrane protein
LLSTLGFIFALRSIKEKNSIKKIVGMLINFAMFLLFVSVIVANVLDIYRVIK